MVVHGGRAPGGPAPVPQAYHDRKLFLANLSFGIDSEDAMRSLLANRGLLDGVHEIKVPLDPEEGKPRGYAFVSFQTTELATRALEALDGAADGCGRAMEARFAQRAVAPEPGNVPIRSCSLMTMYESSPISKSVHPMPNLL